MRKICDSSRCLCINRFSACAEARSVPNGFSTMTRRQPRGVEGRVRPAALSCSTTVPYAEGGIAR